MMFKHIGLLARKEGLTHEEFTDYWKETHGDIASKMEGLVRYQQVHPLNRESAPCDGLAELYFETLEDLTAALGAEGERDFDPDLPNAAQARADANNFLEISERPKIVGEEITERDRVDWDTEGLIKNSIFMVKNANVSHDEFLKLWVSDYVPEVKEISDVVRHTRILPNSPDISEFNGVIELYFEDSVETRKRLGIDNASTDSASSLDQSGTIPSVEEILPLESVNRFVGIEHIQKRETKHC